MYVKKITYEDYNNLKRTEEFYFNLTHAEVTEMDLSIPGGINAYIRQITAKLDIPKLMELAKMLIKKSYGVKSPDGRRFMKSKELLDEFLETEAYSVFFMELTHSDEAMFKFFTGIFPADLSAEISKDDMDKAKKQLLNGEVPDVTAMANA